MRTHGQWPLARAAVAGVLAYLAGYLVAFGWVATQSASVLADVTVRVRAGATEPVTSNPSLTGLVGDVAPSTVAGWVLANGHFVRIVEWSYPTTGAVVPNLLLSGPPGRLALFAVPPIVLAAGGAALAREETAGTVDELPVIRLRLPAGAVRGMALWVGYLPAMVVASFAFQAPTTHASMAPLAPGLIATVVVAGGVYPVVFGALGGWLATRYRG